MNRAAFGKKALPGLVGAVFALALTAVFAAPNTAYAAASETTVKATSIQATLTVEENGYARIEGIDYSTGTHELYMLKDSSLYITAVPNAEYTAHFDISGVDGSKVTIGATTCSISECADDMTIRVYFVHDGLVNTGDPVKITLFILGGVALLALILAFIAMRKKGGNR